MVRRIKAKLVPGLRDQGLSRNVYCFNVCWAKNLMSKNTEPFPSKGGVVPFSWTVIRGGDGHGEVHEGTAATRGRVVCEIRVLRGGCDPRAGVSLFLVKSVFRVSSLIFFGFRHEECRPVVCFTGCPSCRT